MPRIRTVKPDFFHDECLVGISLRHRLTFIGLWLYADREGRLEDRPKYLKAQIWPYERCDMEKILSELDGKYIQRYQIDGRRYIQIVNFLKHQKPHHTERDSTLPLCPESELSGKQPLINGEAPDGREGKGREGKGKIYMDVVLLTDSQYDGLIKRYGKEKAKSLLEDVNNYCMREGKKYKSYIHAIHSFAKNEKKWEKPKQETGKTIKEYDLVEQARQEAKLHE